MYFSDDQLRASISNSVASALRDVEMARRALREQIRVGHLILEGAPYLSYFEADAMARRLLTRLQRENPERFRSMVLELRGH